MASNNSMDRYAFTKESKGLALIFNNVNFDRETLKEREGSDDDVTDLKDALESMGFDESDICQAKDKETEDMKAFLEKRLQWAEKAKPELKPDCFICVILTHGTSLRVGEGHRRVKTDHVYGKEGSMPLKDMMDMVQNCEALIRKPKIFIVQACRGNAMSEPVPVHESIQPTKAGDDTPASDTPETEPTSVDADPAGPSNEDGEHAIPYDIQVGQDCLLVYATQPGFFSFRGKTCTPFIEHFCQNVEDKKDTEFDFLSLLTRVSHDVAFKFESYAPSKPELDKKKQMPWIASRLTKNVVFGRVKASSPGDSDLGEK